MSKPKKQAEDTAPKPSDPESGAETTETPDEVGGTPEAAEPAPADEMGSGPESETGTEPDDPWAALEAERDSFREKWLRAVAEMENVRKRSRKELLDSRRFAQAEVLRPLLEVHDNFERALQSFDQDADTEADGAVRAGVDLIFQRFQAVLKDRGVRPIEALDLEFDPRVHEAVGQLAREGIETGTVIEVVQTGFVLGDDFVLRPARVIVAQ